MTGQGVYKSAATGEFVTQEEAMANPDETYLMTTRHRERMAQAWTEGYAAGLPLGGRTPADVLNPYLKRDDR